MGKEEVDKVRRTIEQNPSLRKRIYDCLIGNCKEKIIGESTRIVYRIEDFALKVPRTNFLGQEEIVKEIAFFNYIENRNYPAPEFTIGVKTNDMYGILTQDLTEGGKYIVRDFGRELKQLENYKDLLRKWSEYYGALCNIFGERINTALFVQIEGNSGQLIFGDGDQLKVTPEIIEELDRDYKKKSYIIEI